MTMQGVQKRKLQELGGSLYVSLPQDWITKFNLKKGSEVLIALDGVGKLQILPQAIQEQTQKTTIIDYDYFIFRNLIRDYLFGSDFIKIRKLTPFTRKEREDILNLVHNLLNLEVIEEDKSQITVQNLKSDIPIRKMIDRMYFLTKTMIEDIINEANNKEVLQSVIDRDKVVGKFYLATIMQQRAFLTNRWSEDLSFTQILGLRLVAQNIEKIGDELKALVSTMLEGKKIKMQDIEFLRSRYEQAYNAHTKRDIKSAQQFWKTEKDDKKRVSYNDHLVRIYDYIKDISDLVI
jgi:phosphate uptake regulator